jgi:hypothetical protein
VIWTESPPVSAQRRPIWYAAARLRWPLAEGASAIVYKFFKMRPDRRIEGAFALLQTYDLYCAPYRPNR